MRQKKILQEKIYRDIRKEVKSEQISWNFHSLFIYGLERMVQKMKDKKKLSKLEKCLVREFEADMETADRFLRDEEYSLPCGSSPGMFLSELFQSCSNMPETDPFSMFAADQDDLLAASKISELSGKEDGGGCMISLGRRICDINGCHYAISDTVYIQARVKDSDICCSLLLDAADIFAAEVFADSYSGRCFMMVDVAGSDRICIPLHGFRLLSIHKKRNRWEDTGLVVEYRKSVYTSMYDNIVCGTALGRIRKTLGMDNCKDRCINKQIKR